MLQFEKDGDGFLVTEPSSGRALFRIKTTEVVSTKVPRVPGPGEVTVDKTVTLPREKWLYHPCAGRFSEAQLKALLAEIPNG